MKKSILFSLIATSLFATSSYDVALKAESARSGFLDAKSKQKMVLINASGKESIREMESKNLEKPLGSKTEGDKSLIEFLSPADVAGTKLLTYENFDRDDDQWLYLPALKRVKRIASKNKSGSFMGSEFSYEDISSWSIEKYNYKGEATEEKFNEIECYKYERIPKDKYSGYTKQLVWVNKENFTVVKIEYFDRKSELLKVAMFENQKIKGVWRTKKIQMKNLQSRKETILTWENDEIKLGLKEKEFSKRVLKR